jgi:hypothetical protein
MSDGPNKVNETRARKGVTGGQATYPQARCHAASRVTNSS